MAASAPLAARSFLGVTDENRVKVSAALGKQAHLIEKLAG